MTDRAAFTPDSLLQVRRLGAFDVSPDGRWIVATVDELSEDGKKYDTNLHRLDLREPSRGPVALTRSTRRKALPRFTPDGRLLFFLAQPDASRRRPRPPDDAARDPKDDAETALQVHAMDVEGGEAECLTDFPGGVTSFRITADGRRLVMTVLVDPEARDLAHDRALHREWKDRKSSGVEYPDYPLRYWDKFYGRRHPHLVVADASGQNARDLTPGMRLGLDEADWDVSPDGRHACTDLRTIDTELRFERNLHLVDLATGERRALTTGTAQHWGARFSPDGRRLACAVQPEELRVTGKRDVKVIDLETGKSDLVTAGTDLWPNPPSWLDDHRLAYTADDHGSSVIRVLTLGEGERALTSTGHASELHASPDGGTLYYVLDRINAPAELHAQAVGGDAKRLTGLNDAFVSSVNLSPGVSRTVKGHDGVDVQVWEVRPADFDPKKKHPVLLWIHGGPLGAFLDWFHFRWNPQIFASAGYVVVMANPRGSTGFGQEFIQGNNGDWGNRCYQDLMKVADAYEQEPWVDRDRMAAMGASFGGYMVNWIAGHTDRFRCLVSHAGLFNLPAFWGTTDCGPEWELEFGGVPWANPELFDRWSPHHHVDHFRTPTLVIHGELDYRVPLGEGLAMYQALRKKAVPAKFLYFPDENHWILKPANMKQWNEVVLGWLGSYLK